MKRMQPTHWGTHWHKKGVAFRLWAPTATSVQLLAGGQAIAMKAEEDGWYRHLLEDAKAGMRYEFLINGTQRIPDPASRFQPEDVNGSSELVDPHAFEWSDDAWKGRPWEEAVIYELHPGSFTPQGGFQGIEEKLDYLNKLGVTALELMPVADFSGKRGWGYDGVLPYAPESSYGRPEDLKRLVDAAHARGMMVLLDVVYNHFGPSGNYLHTYAENFFTDRYQTPWGAAINFAELPVRNFFIDNALYWLNEYHFDGLRFDAVHAIADESAKHILYDIADAVKESVLEDRHVHLILENDKNEARYLTRNAMQQPIYYTAQWNDDYHHAFHVLLAGETGGYYEDYKETPLACLGRCLTQGFAYQGDPSTHRKGYPRGEKSDHLPPSAFIAFLQNHDQIGNRAMGDRLSMLAPAERLALARAIFLLSPQPPMLFMGEEWGAKTPFLYFCDFTGELADAVREGRRKEFAAFPEFSNPAKRAQIPDPNAEETYARSRLNWSDLDKKEFEKITDVTRNLLALRQRHIVPLLKSAWEKSSYHLLNEHVLEVRWEFAHGALTLAANFSETTQSYETEGTVIWGEGQSRISPWQCTWLLEETYHD